MSLTYSTVGLICCFIPVTLHGPEAILPLWGSRFVTNCVLPFFGGELPSNPIQADDQEKALESIIQAFPSESWKNSANYLFLLIFEQKQGASGFIAAAAGSIYAAMLPLSERHPVHFMFCVLSITMAIGNANHATGWKVFGEHPFVSTAGRNVGLAFVPFWAVSAFCNYMAYTESKALLAKQK